MKGLLKVWSTFGLLLFATFAVSSAFAASTRVAHLEGRQSEVQLKVSSGLERIFGAFREWETQLRAQGIQVQFLIGAGDLRRAILQQDIEGPGDVEIFIHLQNQIIQPLSVEQTLSYLGAHGVDVVQKMHEIFGPSKVVDTFVKDQTTMAKEKPYTAGFGIWPEMGDTSLNELRYSPTANKIYGADENLAALEDGRILYLEKNRSKKLPSSKLITGLQYRTDYPESILRQAIRNLRLQIDLSLSPASHQLHLDPGFDPALHGFELFFENVPASQEIPYEMDDVYTEQLLKIFRNRTNPELAKIREFFNTRYPKTLEILKALGIDVDLLTSPRDARVDLQSLESRAISHNLWFKKRRAAESCVSQALERKSRQTEK